MIILNNTLYVEFAEMVSAGISERTLKSWVDPIKVSNPGDARVKLFTYELLADKYQLLVKQQFGCPYKYHSGSAIKKQVQKDPQAFLFFSTYNTPAGQSLDDTYIKQYTQAATWLNYLSTIKLNKRYLQLLGLSSRVEFYDLVIQQIKAEGVNLPGNQRRLKDKIKAYKADGYATLISKKFGNNNGVKISQEAGDWLCAYYSNGLQKPTPEQTWAAYNLEATSKGWDNLTSPSTVYKFLHHEANIQRWYGARHGWNKAKEMFGIQFKNIRAIDSNTLWYADGTGLNYRTSDHNQQRVYWVMDDTSEVVLGWDIAPTETHQSAYRAFKMAALNSGVKPKEVRYDGAGSNGLLGTILDNLADKLHFSCEAYNGKSKSIEPVTLRFQRQVMKGYWFFTGQNRTAKTDNMQANWEELLKHNKELYPLATIKLLFEENVAQWNNQPHPRHKGKTRMQVYNETQSADSTPFTVFDQVEAFWVTSKEPRAYKAEGITVQIGKDKHLFEVYKDADHGQVPDIEWRKTHIGGKFIRKYDPEDLTECWLYEETPQGLRFVAIARKKEEFHIAITDHTPGETAAIKRLQQLRKQDNKARKEENLALTTAHGTHPDQIIEKQREEIGALTLSGYYRTNDLTVPPAYGEADGDESKIID